MSTKPSKEPSTYAAAGRRMASAAKKAKAPPKPKEAPPAPLPAWMRGDKEGLATLPKRPPAPRSVRIGGCVLTVTGYDPEDPSTHYDPTLEKGGGA